MDEDISVVVIKKTQTTLGKFVKSPELSENLLRRPPFRFLHDIVRTIVKQTRLFRGLFNENEFDSEFLKEKELRILFMNKVITVLQLATKQKLNATSKSVLTGRNPVATNQMLQLIACALENNVNTDLAVKEVLNKINQDESFTELDASITSPSIVSASEGQQIEQSSISSLEKKLQTSKKGDVIKKKKKEQDLKRETSRIPTKIKTDNQARNKTQGIGITKTKEGNHDTVQTKRLQTVKDANSKTAERPTEAHVKKRLPIKQSKQTCASIADIQYQDETEVSSLDLTGRSNFDLQDDLTYLIEKEEKKEPVQSKVIETNTRKITVDVIQSENSNPYNGNSKTSPPESEPRDIVPPTNNITELHLLKALSKLEESLQPSPRLINTISSQRPPSARPSAPRIRTTEPIQEIDLSSVKSAPLCIIKDTTNDEADDEYLITTADSQNSFASPPMKAIVDSNAADSCLVQQILQTKRELEGGCSKPLAARIHFEEAHYKAKIEGTQSAIQKYATLVQKLSHRLDFVEEDVDSMRTEYQNYHEEYKKSTLLLKEEEKITEKQLQPLKEQLQEVEQQLMDEIVQVVAIKGRMIENELAIVRLVQRPGRVG